MDRLQDFFRQRLRETPMDFFRYMYDKVKWQGRMLGLVGPRGVGKSTMLLQHIKQHDNPDQTLYVSADHLYFSEHTLVDLADRFVKMGGKHLYIDEIHKYENWSRELKQIYDSHSDLQVVFTGSSVLDIMEGQADLSRRAPIYEMQGMSFREYLQFFHRISVPIYALGEILSHKAEIPGVNHPLPYFSDYLKRGYYPYAKDVDFEMELLQVINQTMEMDIPKYARMNTSVGSKLKQLLMVVARSVPFKPVNQKLADVTGVSRNNIGDYLLYMERAGMIAQLRDATGGVRGLGKADKLYLDNTNIIYALTPDRADIGNIRETFFMNQMRVRQDVAPSKTADFTIDGKEFEIGGKKKGQRQIASAEEGYVVKDDIEFGYANVIPLWAFGLNY